MRQVVFGLVVGAVLGSSQAGAILQDEAFTMLNVIPSRTGEEEVAAQDAIEYVERTGNQVCLYSLTLHPQGKPAMKMVDAAVASYRRWTECLKGTSVRPGVLLQAIVGHWTQDLAEKDSEKWQRAVSIRGRLTRYCPFDPGYRNYIFEVGRKLAECRPAVILGDDDICAFSPDAECFCPLHTAEFNRRTGRRLTQDEFRALILAAKPGDADHSAFVELQRDTVAAVCGLLRKGIDAVDPTIPAGTCTPGWVWAMRFGPDFARAIAGRGQVPFFRLPNGQYYEHLPKESIGALTLRTLSECERTRGSGAWMLDEADTYPHCLWSKSSVAFHGKLAVAAFSGVKGAKLWYVNAHKGQFPVSRHYTDILAEHRGFYSALAAVSHGSSASGVFVPCHPEFPSEPVSECRYVWSYDVNGWADMVFSWYGVPFRPTFDFDRKGVYALSGSNSVARFTDDQLRRMLSRKALVDGDAAVALVKRGFGNLLGVGLAGTVPLFTGEYDEVNRNFLSYPKTANPPVFTCQPGARPLAHMIWRESGFVKSFERVAPSAVVWTNELGGVVVTTAMKAALGYAVRLGSGRQRYVYALLDAFNGGRVTDNICANEQNVLALSRRAGNGTDLVLVQNLNFDSDGAVLLRRGERPALVEELDRRGIWHPSSFTYADGIVRIEGSWAFYETKVFRMSDRRRRLGWMLM